MFSMHGIPGTDSAKCLRVPAESTNNTSTCQASPAPPEGCGVLNDPVSHEPEILQSSAVGVGGKVGGGEWGAAGGRSGGGVEAERRGDEEEFTYDWYTVGELAEGEEGRGLGGRGLGEVYGSGVPRVSLLEYQDLVDSQEETEEDGVLDEEFDSNAEMSDYPLTDPGLFCLLNRSLLSLK